MKVSIYHLDKELVLTDEKEHCRKCDNIISIQQHHSYSTIYNFLQDWLNSKINNWCFYFDSDFTLHSFLTVYLPYYFKVLYAAGGVIFHPQKQAYLFIYKRGFWDLPKGKIDAGEQPEIAAIRECNEETGISNLIIKENIGITNHIFEQNNQMILKITQWYLMETSFSDNLKPQIEEGIEKVEWLSKSDITEKLIPQTYPSIIDLLWRVKII